MNLKSMNLKNLMVKYQYSLIILILLALIVGIITILRINIQIDIGPLSDSIDFYSYALLIAGHGYGYTDLLRPPFFPFVTSFLVLMGYNSINTIFVSDGLFFMFGIVGLYLLLNLRFNEIESFLGSLFYATFPIVLAVLGVGFSDLASISLTIWAFYFTILAVNRNSRFFYLSFPLAMLAFLTRYNSALLIFPIFLYILIERSRIFEGNTHNLKNMLIGILLSFLLLIPVFLFFYHNFGNILYPFFNFSDNAGGVVAAQSESYNSDPLFFIKTLPYFIGIQGAIAVLIMILFSFVVLINRLKSNMNFDLSTKFNQFFEDIKANERSTQLKFGFSVFLLAVFVISFGKIHYMATEILFFSAFLLICELLKNVKTKYFEINVLFLGWFMVFLIFHSVYAIKDNRYFLIMAPPVAYFLILGLSESLGRVRFKIRNQNILLPLTAIFLTVVMIMTAVGSLPTISEANNDTKVTNEQVDKISQWLISYDPNIKNENVYSDFWPAFSWYLQTNVKMVPIIQNNSMYANGVKEYIITPEDNEAYNNYLVKNNAYYYISIRPGLNLTSYEVVKQISDVTIYKRK